MDQVFDLFGDPVPANHGGRGRPEHLPTTENRNKVTLLLALGWSDGRIANALRITKPTLRKHYFSVIKFREEQRARLDAAVAATLWKQFQQGSTSAGKAFSEFVEKNDLMLYGQTAQPQKPEKPAKLGKKEAALADAQRPDTGSTLGELMAQRQGGDDGSGRPN